MKESVLTYLRDAAAAYGEKIAFADAQGNAYTFRQLEEMSRRVGAFLRDTLPGQSQRPIAVIVGRNARCIPVFLGAARSGHFYVPIDGSLPAERMEKMLSMLAPACVVRCDRCDRCDRCERGERDGAACAESGIEDEVLFAYRAAAESEFAPVQDDQAMYGIFTSGSTGFPKLVLKSHRALWRFIEDYASRFGFDETDVLGNQIPFHFDASTKDLFVTLRCGASTHVIEKSCFAQPGRLAQVLTEKKITSIVWVPSALLMLSRFGVLEKIAFPALRRVFFVGEAMPAREANRWYAALPGVTIVNLYGATENAGNCLYHVMRSEAEPDARIPLGRAFSCAQVFLLDEDDRLIAPQQAGVSGEICISGEILALGYYRNPEATAEKFMSSPLDGAQRMYRTGDLAFYNAQGELVFESRKDHQIKLNGYRIELGEIEHAALQAGAEAACCVYDGARRKIILCYTAREMTEDALRAHLKKEMPAYMLPSRYVRLEEMPLNANGKMHRTQLAALYAPEAGGKGTP